MTKISLRQLGWQPYFQQQLSLDEWQTDQVARITQCHRSHCIAQAEEQTFNINHKMAELAVGDWVLLNSEGLVIKRLDRLNQLKRKSAGTKVDEQLLAANIDLMIIVTSLNEDFKLSRVERYLALAYENHIEPLLVLSKADLCTDTASHIQQLQGVIDPHQIIAMNSLEKTSAEQLLGWLKVGKTGVIVGSSGVGKSSLVNTLCHADQKTAQIRKDDSKGRHTTTGRSMHFVESGGVIIDTPGIRELQLFDCHTGIEETFNDIVELAKQCRFGNCQHGSEPDCAIQAAIVSGILSLRRFENYLKLNREQAHNSATMAERRAKDRARGKFIKSVLAGKKQLQED